jgi:hypothetical protein
MKRSATTNVRLDTGARVGACNVAQGRASTTIRVHAHARFSARSRGVVEVESRSRRQLRPTG